MQHGGRGWWRNSAERKVCVSACHIDEDCPAQLCIAPVLERRTHHKQTGGVRGAAKRNTDQHPLTEAPDSKHTRTQTRTRARTRACTHTQTHKHIQMYTITCTAGPCSVSFKCIPHRETRAPQWILLSSTEKKMGEQLLWFQSCLLLFLSSPTGEQLESSLPLSVCLSSSPPLSTFRISGNKVRDLTGSFICLFVCLIVCPLWIFFKVMRVDLWWTEASRVR